MRYLIVAVWLGISLLAPQESRAQEDWGAGVILGEPTGLTFKAWTSGRTAIDAAVAWSFSGRDSFQFHADYLWHNFSWQDDTDIEIKGLLPFYYGVGARVKLGESGRNDHDTSIGIRVPGGLSFLLDDAPVELFIEIVPILDLVPDTDFDLNGAVGARFYFN